ncbi:carboxy terminal-processing peptidase [Vibrio ostreicida]|uniref:carboxy terminal-processing peptidase n=1 Tax=Vibrio ostreicida TaxID=526588 RepID=UPI003B590F1C
MKCRSKLSLIAASLLLAAPIANALEAKINLEDLPVLVPETQYITASKRVEDKLTSSHYKHIKLNDAFSQKIFWRYVESLDYSRNVFTQVDIDSFKKWSSGIDDQLKSGQTQIAFDLYNASMKRRYERFAYALSLLDKEMDFKVDESVELDRREMPWAKDTAELDELWRKRVKYDALNLKLAGKDWPAIKEVLGKRYNNALKRLSQTHNEDAFQLYMNAFTRAIDPHTTYLSPQSAEKFQTDMNLSLEGIGAVLQMTDDYTVIRSLVVGGPASNSKQLAEGDKIIGVGQDKEDIVDVIGWRLDDVVKLIKGPKGTKVYLQILSEGKDAKADVITIVRDKIRLEDRAVKSEVIERGDKKIGVLSVPSFYVGLAKDTDQLLAELKQQQVDGIVVDLRNNGGGALTEASALTGLFIASGPVVQVRDSYGRINVKGDFDDKLSYDGPMTVLINRNSASASEIFAAALQDYGRAIILGENSFGKGTVQQHLRLSKLFDLFDKQLGAVQYTIQKFYRIDGGSTQLKGVKPDIAFPTLINPDETGESVEDNALPWDRIAKAKYQVLQRNEKQIAMLNTQHQARIADDLEFQFIAEDIAQYKADKDDNTLSLNEKVRKQESDDADKLRLQRINLRQKAKDAEPFTTLDDVPKDYERPDVYLDEAVAITVDSLK